MAEMLHCATRLRLRGKTIVAAGATLSDIGAVRYVVPRRWLHSRIRIAAYSRAREPRAGLCLTAVYLVGLALV